MITQEGVDRVFGWIVEWRRTMEYNCRSYGVDIVSYWPVHRRSK